MLEIVQPSVYRNEVLKRRVGVRIDTVEQAKSVFGVCWRLESAYDDKALEPLCVEVDQTKLLAFPVYGDVVCRVVV